MFYKNPKKNDAIDKRCHELQTKRMQLKTTECNVAPDINLWITNPLVISLLTIFTIKYAAITIHNINMMSRLLTIYPN